MKIQRPESAPQVETWKTCSECGSPYEADDSGSSLCLECLPTQRRDSNRDRLDRLNTTTTELGYGYRWQQLSKRARQQQDFCSDCGSPHDLTADHTTTAWRRYEAGLPIRLEDIDVVCRRCNTERGPARGPDASDEWRSDTAARIERERAEIERLDPDPWG